jgi:hypothetical protein
MNTAAASTNTRQEPSTMTIQTVNPHMEPVKIASDRFVAFGHYVTNFGQKCVVTGSRDLGPQDGGVFLFVRALRSDGSMESDGWMANPAKCV